MSNWQPKVASSCAACGRRLTDGVSIEKGIGPVCRKKYLYEDAYPIDDGMKLQLAVFLTESAIPQALAVRIGEACLDDNSRRAANLLVHAASTEGAHAAIEAAHALRLLGYDVLANKVQERLSSVQIKVEGSYLIVRTPFDPAFLIEVREIRGRRWDFTRKINAIPVAQKVALFEALLRCYPGALGVGPKGPFVIERKERAA